MNQLTDAVTGVKATATVAIGTVATGFGKWLKLIPDDIGKLGALVGIVLSLVLIGVHLHNAWITHKRYKDDIKRREQDRSNRDQ